MWELVPALNPRNHVFTFGEGMGGGAAGSIQTRLTPSYSESSAYRTWSVRSRTAAYDASLGGYCAGGGGSSYGSSGQYSVPGAVTVTDDMAITNDGAPQARFTGKTDPKHVFREAPGHMTQDTPENRALLENATLKKYYRGLDLRKNSWYSYIDSCGRQVWVSTRGDSIRNGGINGHPLPWDDETGYCRNVKK